jgi:glycerophosphoryl diester phosphodiesterase
VGSFFATEFSGERPPLLDDVLEAFCPETYIDIELKTRKIKDDPLPGLLADKIRQFGDRIVQSVTVSSFNPFAIRTFKRCCPRVPAAIIWCVDPEVPLILRRGLGRFLSHCDYLKPEYAQAGRFFRFPWPVLEKRPIIPWSIDDPALAEDLVRTGCGGIITNRPQDMGFIIEQSAGKSVS